MPVTVSSYPDLIIVMQDMGCNSFAILQRSMEVWRFWVCSCPAGSIVFRALDFYTSKLHLATVRIAQCQNP